MGSISDYLENELLDHVLKVGAYTPASTLYLALSTADPTDDGSGLAEPSGNNYAREIIAFDAASSRTVQNSSLITFNQASGAWGTLTHWSIMDALSGGNMLAHGSLSTSKTVVSGNTPFVAANEVDITFNAGDVSDYLANKFLDFAFRNQAFSQPDIHIALCTVAITDSDTGDTITEPSGNNYGRAPRSGQSDWNTASGGVSSNNGAITFNTPSGTWGLCVDVALLDAVTSGNLLMYSDDIVDQTPNDGDTVQFADTALTITLS